MILKKNADGSHKDGSSGVAVCNNTRFVNENILHEWKSQQINDLKMNTYRLNNNND